MQAQQHQHPQSTIAEGKCPIGGGDDGVVSNVAHGMLLNICGYEFSEFNHAVHVAPFIVVPNHHFHHSLVGDPGALGIYDTASWVPGIIAAHQRAGFITQNPFERLALGGLFNGGVDLFNGCVPLHVKDAVRE